MADGNRAGPGGANAFPPRRTLYLSLGLAIFALVYLSPPWPAATDPAGAAVPLSHAGKAAIGLFLLAATWWVTEVVPIGVTAIAIGVAQSLLAIRDARAALSDFMDPAVWFVFASLSIGVAFTKTGLTKRMAYRALGLVGERTSMVYLACFLVTAALTLLMAHTAVAAAVFPLLLLIHGRYTSDTGPTRFGKGLFIGMAFACGAGSIITLLGSPRTVLAIGFFARIDGEAVDFLELSWYLAPVGALMVVVIWLFVLLRYPPEKPTLPGLADEARRLYRGLGPWSRDQALVLAVVALAVGVLAARPWVPALTGVDSAAILLLATLAFFVLGVLDLSDLESLSWNIVLLFGGAMSIGLCLWQTGATAWMADHWLGLVGGAHWAVIVLSLAGLVLAVANFVMNAAAIAIALPFALVCAHQIGLHGRPVLFACLAAAGMPFLLLVGAAPNAIAYASKQFTPREFWLAGLPVSLLLLVVLALFVLVVWPLMGMPIHR